MRRHLAGTVLFGAALVAVPADAEVHLALANGRVSLSARDATVRQILTEWARVGQARIVNLERVNGAPVTIELSDVPESQALDIILRSVSGYLAAPRAESKPGASLFDRILLLPTSSPTAARPAPAPAGATAFQTAPFPAQPQPPSAQPDVEQEDVVVEDARPPVPPRPVPGRAPAFGAFPPGRGIDAPNRATPEPDPDAAPQGPVSYPAPTAPVGVAVPGMPVPAPQQPGQAPQPGQPRR